MARKDIIKAEIDGNSAMQAIGDNYPAIALLFNARPQVTNPAEQQQVARTSVLHRTIPCRWLGVRSLARQAR